MPKLDNPAGRLYDILSDAQNKSDQLRAGQVWAEVFEIEEADTVRLMEMLVDLMKLVDMTKESIRLCEDVDHDLHLRAFPRIEKVVRNVNLLQPWKNLKSRLDGEPMVRLEYVSDMLSRRTTEAPISGEDLAGLQASVETLEKDVLSAGLPKDLEETLMEGLESIRRAILAYRINGAHGLRQALQFSIGAATFVFCQPMEEDKKRPLVDGFGKVIARLGELVSLALKMKELAEPYLPQLTSGNSNTS